MEVNPFNRNQHLERKRQVDKDLRQAEQAAGNSPSARQDGDAAKLSSRLAPEQIERYVSILKNMDPTDLHRVERFKEQIEDGTYQAHVDDLIDPLLDFLSDGGDSDKRA